MNDSVLKPSIELLIQDSGAPIESVISMCVQLFRKHKTSLFSAIFEVIQENINDKAEVCKPIFELIKRISELDEFTDEMVPKLAKKILTTFHDIETRENPCTKPALDDLVLLAKKNPKLIYPLFSNLFAASEKINYLFLMFFYKCISLRDQIAKEFMPEILNLIFSLFKRKDEEVKDYRELFLDIFLGSFQVVDINNIPPAFCGIYNAVLETCIEDQKLRPKAFKFLSVGVATITPYEAASKLKIIAEKLKKFLAEDETKHHTATCIAALMVRAAEIDSPEFISCLKDFCDPLLNYVRGSYKSFVEQTDDIEVMRGIPEAVRGLQVIRQHTGSKIVDSCIQNFANEANLYVLSNLTFAGDERERIARNLGGMLNLTSNSQHAKCLALEIFAKLVEEDADIHGLSPAIVRTCSTSRQIVNDFERVILSVTKDTIVFDGMLDSALDPHYIIGARTLFAALKMSSFSSMKTILPKDKVVARCLLLCFCPMFSARSKSDILFSVGTAIANAEFIAQANIILKKNCPNCAKRILRKITQEYIVCVSDPNMFIEEMNNFYNALIKESHPDTPGKPLLTQAQIAQFRAALLSATAACISATPLQGQAPQKLAPLLKHAELRHVDEAQNFGDDLAFISTFAPSVANDAFTKKNSPKDNSLGKRVMLLEYGSKQKPPLYQEHLYDDDIPLNIIAAVQKRNIKNTPTPSDQHIAVVSKILHDSQIPFVLSCACKSLLMLLKSGKALESTIIRKAMTAMPISESISNTVKEALKLTSPEMNFDNLCFILFSEQMNENQQNQSFKQQILDMLVDLCDNIQKPELLKKPSVAAAVSVMLIEQETNEVAVKASQKIFICNKSMKEFTMMYLLAGDAPTKESFIEFVFSFMNFAPKWAHHAAEVLETIFTEERFKFLTAAGIRFLYTTVSISSIKTVDQFIPIAKILFENDRNTFAMSLLDRVTVAPRQLVTLLANMKQTLATFLDAGFRMSANDVDHETRYHQSLLRIIEVMNAIPEKQTLQCFVFVVFVIAQTRRYADQCRATLKVMKKYFNIESAVYSFDSWKQGGDVLDCVETLFSCVDKEITMFHISPFIRFAQEASIIGYGCIIPQGRPLLMDVLNIKNQAKPLNVVLAASILRIAPKFKFLPPERYAETQINELVDFIIEYLKVEKTQLISIQALESLYSWLPTRIIESKLETVIEGLTSVLLHGPKKEEKAPAVSIDGKEEVQVQVQEPEEDEKEYIPPDEIFRIIGTSCDNLSIISSRVFKNRSPLLCDICLFYGCRGNKAAIAAYEKMTSSCGMLSSSNAFRNLSMTRSAVNASHIPSNFDVMPTYCMEMDKACLLIASQLVNDEKCLLRVEAANLVCCAIHEKNRNVDAGTQRCLMVLLVADSAKLKCGVLGALRRFPPPISPL